MYDDTLRSPWIAFREGIAAQIRFFRVSEEELKQQRAQFQTSQMQIKIEETTFNMRYSYQDTLHCQYIYGIVQVYCR